MSKTLRFIPLICVVTLAVLAGACTNPADSFGRFEQLPAGGWAYGDTIAITTDSLSSTGKRLSVAVRHNDDFPYRNLWIEVSGSDASGKMIRDTVDIMISDSYGRWLGKGIGDSYQCSAPIDGIVNIAGAATVKLRHVMRVDTVPGLEQIGIIIESEKP